MKQRIKLVVALAIPLAIAWIFVASHQTAQQEIAEVSARFRERPSARHTVIDNYNMYEMDEKNPRHWQLTARTGEVINSNQVRLTDVKMEYYDGNSIKMSLVAPLGEADADTKYVKLSSSPVSCVIAQGAQGKASLQARTVELTKKNQFTATGGVNIEWPKVAKVTGDMATGRIDLADFKDFRIVGNTHAEIMVN